MRILGGKSNGFVLKKNKEGKDLQNYFVTIHQPNFIPVINSCRVITTIKFFKAKAILCKFVPNGKHTRYTEILDE